MRNKFINIDHRPYREMNSFKSLHKIVSAAMSPHPDRRPKQPLPALSFDWQQWKQVVSKIDSYSWFGHSTVLLGLQGKSLLLDPVFNSASPISPVMPRFQSPVCQPHDLGIIDILLISHNHYDHLDLLTIRKLIGKVRKIIVPIGLKKFFCSVGFSEDIIAELNWWQEYEDDSFKITCAPAQHFSGRTLLDRNQTLWCSWVLQDNRHTIYFSGDSGFSNHFNEIHRKFGAFDIAFMENGQYNPLWQAVHMLPSQSALAGYQLNANYFIPIHWSAYSLSLHAWYDPANQALEHASQYDYQLQIPLMGQIQNIKEKFPLNLWWVPS